MSQISIHEMNFLWFLAEGSEDDLPVIYRGKQVSDDFVGDASLANLLVARLIFAEPRNDGFPTEHGYESVNEFEARYIDLVESQRLGILVFTKTWNGAIAYFLYVGDVDAVAEILAQFHAEGARLELSAADDPEWSEYKSFVAGVGFGS
jgi:hypothetical protein